MLLCLSYLNVLTDILFLLWLLLLILAAIFSLLTAPISFFINPHSLLYVLILSHYLQCYSMSSIFVLLHFDWWLHFSFPTRSAIPYFIVSPLITVSWCYSLCYIFRSAVQPLYSLPQLQEIEYTQFLVIFTSMLGLTHQKFPCWVELLLNLALILHGSQTFWIFSDKP